MNNRDRPENPAKAWLKRYRAMLARRQSLERAIAEAYDRATSITAKLKEVNVSGGGGPGDRMAEDVTRAIDSTVQLKYYAAIIDTALGEILEAIEAVQDETQKAILTMRYIEGAGWADIQERLHYERTQTLVIHGRALWSVRNWMNKTAKAGE